MNISPVYSNFTVKLSSGGLWVGGVCKPISVSGHNHVMLVKVKVLAPHIVNLYQLSYLLTCLH